MQQLHNYSIAMNLTLIRANARTFLVQDRPSGFVHILIINLQTFYRLSQDLICCMCINHDYCTCV